jgi:hypothetical protein
MSTEADRTWLRSQLTVLHDGWLAANLHNRPEDFLAATLDVMARPRIRRHRSTFAGPVMAWSVEGMIVRMIEEQLSRWRRARRAAERAHVFLTPTCTVCQQPFESSRSNARTCSPACRQRAHRLRMATAGGT